MGWFVSLVMVIALEIDKIQKNISLEMEFLNWFAKPLLSAVIAGLAARLLADRLLFDMAGQRTGLVLGIGVLTGMYVLMVYLTGCIKKEDIRRLFRRPAHF
jgi:hypothetical protein